MKKSILPVRLICPNCDHEPKANKKLTNENWTTYNAICEQCGSRLIFEFANENIKLEELSKGDNSMSQCQATNKHTHEQCRRRAVDGYNVCTVHGAGSPKRVAAGIRNRPGAPITTGHNSKYFKEEVLQKIEDFKNDPDLGKLDFEIAYLKTLPSRIEATDLQEADKIVLLEKCLKSIFDNMEKREKIIEARRYSIGVEKLKLLIKYMFSSVSKYVKDPKVLAKIANELREVAAKTDNKDESNSLTLLE
jgi:ribosomal protein L37E